MTTSDLERLTYDFKDICHILGLSEHPVRDLMARAERPLPFIRTGRRVLFSREAVRQWLLDESSRPTEVAV